MRIKYKTNYLISTLLLALLFFSSTVNAQCYVDKVYINSYLHDPNGPTNNFDTDTNGTVSSGRDEFVQLCNDSSGSVNITGWTISDTSAFSHSFSSGTIIPANECLTVVNEWFGTLPSFVYEIGRASPIWNNDGDSIILSNGTDECAVHVPDNSGNGCVMKVSGSTSNSVAEDCSLSPTDLGSSPLPVELLDFTAVLNDNNVTLNWTTASELNNNYFSVEKSSNGLNFREVGVEPGVGTSNQLNSYLFVDDWNPSEPYYRLKQTDFNGEYSFSDVIKIEGSKTVNYITESRDIITIQNKEEDELQYVLATQTGLIMKSGKSFHTIEIHKNKLTSGVYVLQVNSMYGTDVKKIVVH